MINIVSTNLENTIIVSIPFSIVLMAFVQKIKKFFGSKNIVIYNLLFAFLLGIPFGITFYHLDIFDSIWVSVFGFIGAPSLYEALKNYTPNKKNSV